MCHNIIIYVYIDYCCFLEYFVNQGDIRKASEHMIGDDGYLAQSHASTSLGTPDKQPANTVRSPNVDSMLVQRLRRWFIIEPTLGGSLTLGEDRILCFSVDTTRSTYVDPMLVHRL